MELTYALYVYLIVVIVLILVLCRNGIRPWSAVLIGLVTGQVLLLAMAPPSNLDDGTDSGSAYALYMLIQLATPIIVYIYAFVNAVRDQL